MDDLISRERVIATIDSFNVFESRYDQIKLELMIRELPSAQPDVPDTNVGDMISRQAAIDATKKHYRAHDNDLLELIAFDIEQLPSVQPETEWNNHTVACLLAELFGDDCACNYNGIDEWLPEKCEVIDACPNPVGVACWEQFLKHRAGRRTDG